jgi:hypothetical protein
MKLKRNLNLEYMLWYTQIPIQVFCNDIHKRSVDIIFILGIYILLRVWDQGEGVSVYATYFRSLYYYFLFPTCFIRTTISR